MCPGEVRSGAQHKVRGVQGLGEPGQQEGSLLSISQFDLGSKGSGVDGPEEVCISSAFGQRWIPSFES